jgi:inorganic pyrophosphatase
MSTAASEEKIDIVAHPEGAPGTLDYTVRLKRGEKVVSPWHDVPHGAGSGGFWFINEIPRGTTAKLEVCTKVDHNPIKQDLKKGKLRYFDYDMGYGGIPFNYGMLPQTFEDPNESHPDTGCVGDADPIDVVELSGSPLPVGAIRRVKVLGCLAMIDEGETDWKIIAIDASHPRAADWNSISDLTSPEDQQLLAAVRQWFRLYKTPDGKPENTFAFNGEYQGRDYALRIIEEVHGTYKDLLAGKLADTDGVWLPPCRP